MAQQYNDIDRHFVVWLRSVAAARRLATRMVDAGIPFQIQRYEQGEESVRILAVFPRGVSAARDLKGIPFTHDGLCWWRPYSP